MPSLSIVLHTHMPYVEGHGTWPHGEEWLWEAAGTSWLPLLDLLERGGAADAVTLSVTPVLLDQLEAPGVEERYAAWVRDVRLPTFALDAEQARAGGDAAVAAELERAAATDYPTSIAGLAGRLAARADWTSSATHAVLPLIATDAGVRLQVRTGVESHRRRAARPWGGGFWSPECAHAPWLAPLLAAAGVRATCVDLTDVAGIDPHRPLRSVAGPLLVPIDRPVVELVWHRDGYPSHPAYRDSHRLTRYHRRPWRNDGAVYDPDAAREQAHADARDFVERVAARLREGGGDGLCVCALDTELLGHWWHEGVGWLGAVLEECARRGLPLVALDDALDEREAGGALAPAPADLRATTWGTGRDLSTWSGPAVADLAWDARAAELRLVTHRDADATAARALLAVQASDWAFVVATGQAAPYGRARHHAALRALAMRDAHALRGLAPHADPAALLAAV